MFNAMTCVAVCIALHQALHSCKTKILNYNFLGIIVLENRKTHTRRDVGVKTSGWNIYCIRGVSFGAI